MNGSSILKCAGCGAVFEGKPASTSTITCKFCNAVTQLSTATEVEETTNPPDAIDYETMIKQLQPLNMIGGVLVAAFFAIFSTRLFGTFFGLIVSVVYFVLDYIAVTPYSRVGKHRMKFIDSMFVLGFGEMWKPRLAETELGTCQYCGNRHAARGDPCKNSPTKTHLVLEITKRGAIDLENLETVPLAQDRSIWLVAGALVFYWAFSKILH